MVEQGNNKEHLVVEHLPYEQQIHYAHDDRARHLSVHVRIVHKHCLLVSPRSSWWTHALQLRERLTRTPVHGTVNRRTAAALPRDPHNSGPRTRRTRHNRDLSPPACSLPCFHMPPYQLRLCTINADTALSLHVPGAQHAPQPHTPSRPHHPVSHQRRLRRQHLPTG